jgi:ketosteroid isomerase-like protein
MFMKRLLAFAIVGVITATSGCAQAPPAQDTAADQAKLQADAVSWFDYYAKADADGLANLYAEDALLMPPGTHAVQGRPAIKTFLGDDATKSKAAGISIKNNTVTGSGVSGDNGWISGNYTVTDASGATVDTGSYLSVHRRTNGAWLYIRDIWNSDRPPAPPVSTMPTMSTAPAKK